MCSPTIASDHRGSAAPSGGFEVWFLDEVSLTRTFELMSRYSDCPMDLADASLVAATGATHTTRMFTLDRNDFRTYRARCGKSWRSFKLIW
jgi:hypothetical protein